MNATFNTNRQSRILGLFTLCVIVLIALLAAFPAKAFAASASLSIPVEQIFGIAPGVQQDGVFQYELRRMDSSSPLPAGAQGDVFVFTMAGSETRDIGPIVFNHGGIFTYEVRSAAQSAGNLSIDGTIYTVVIAVRNVDGGLVAEIRTIYARSPEAPSTAKLEVDHVLFEHAYGVMASNPDDKFDPPVVKTVQGNPAVPYTFTFRLEAQGDGQPMPTGATGNTFDITTAGSGRATFGTWSYTEAGVFIYSVREIPSENADYVFDTTVYTITDTVTQENGRLVVDRVVTNADNRHVVSMSFLNTYIGTDIEVQEPGQPGPGGVVGPGGEPGPGAGTGTTTGTGQRRPVLGPKTGDYADPIEMIVAMGISTAIALFALVLIYMDRRSEKEHGAVASRAL